MKKVIASPKAPAALGPYSQAIMFNDTLYLSGQLGGDPATGELGATVEEQTRQALANLGAVLEEAGLSYADVVKTTVLLADIADFGAMNAIYAEYFTEDKPARVCYQVAALPKNAKVEIDAIAVKNK
ncbi:MAG: RidA family protein [Bacteroidales bacterium]|nr:RidA family protein [Candidatus Cryptobacteroides onthequi]MCQ2164581.1 RidA family protein [Bacteroidales bacterium]